MASAGIFQPATFDDTKEYYNLLDFQPATFSISTHYPTLIHIKIQIIQ